MVLCWYCCQVDFSVWQYSHTLVGNQCCHRNDGNGCLVFPTCGEKESDCKNDQRQYWDWKWNCVFHFVLIHPAMDLIVAGEYSHLAASHRIFPHTDLWSACFSEIEHRQNLCWQWWKFVGFSYFSHPHHEKVTNVETLRLVHTFHQTRITICQRLWIRQGIGYSLSPCKGEPILQNGVNCAPASQVTTTQIDCSQ